MEAAQCYSVMLGVRGVGFSKGGQKWPQICSTRLSFWDRGLLKKMTFTSFTMSKQFKAYLSSEDGSTEPQLYILRDSTFCWFFPQYVEMLSALREAWSHDQKYSTKCWICSKASLYSRFICASCSTCLFEDVSSFLSRIGPFLVHSKSRLNRLMY